MSKFLKYAIKIKNEYENEQLKMQIEKKDKIIEQIEDNKQKATDLLQALNDLQSINTQSKEYMSETQTIVKQAIEDAMKKALIFG